MEGHNQTEGQARSGQISLYFPDTFYEVSRVKENMHHSLTKVTIKPRLTWGQSANTFLRTRIADSLQQLTHSQHGQLS